MPTYDPEYIDTLVKRKDIRALIKALKDVETVELAKQGLLGIGEPAVHHLIRALRKEHTSYPASRVLKEIGAPSVVPLVQALEREEGSGFAAATLEDIGEPSVEALIDGLQSGRDHARILAVRALGVIGDPRGANPILGVFLHNMGDEFNLTLHQVCLQALERLGVSSRFEEDARLSLDEFVRELERLDFEEVLRPKRTYLSSQVRGVRFRVLKRVVRLEIHSTVDGGKQGWARVRSYSIKRELWLALRVAELIEISAETRVIADESNP